MNKINIRKLFHGLSILLLAAIFITSCNEKTTETEEIAVTSSAVAIKEFHLTANAKVMSNLDSVFFSIDMDRGVIFNADSLPVGTDVSKLIPVITFANTMTKADLVFKKDNLADTTVNYLTNSTDSIDFTYPVTLNVTAANGTSTYTYLLKVNVHTQVPDSLMWNQLSYMQLPSRFPSPKEQKTVKFKEQAYSLIMEEDNSYTIAISSDIEKGEWEKQNLDLGFQPVLRSLTSSENSLWMLSENGDLYESVDGFVWNSTGASWIAIIGAYDNDLLGLTKEGEELMHCHYNGESSITDGKAATDFPISGFTTPGLIESEWYPLPTLMFTGGITSSGMISSSTWAYDGSTWARIDDVSAPALDGAMMVKYVIFRKTGQVFTQREFDAWLLLGGTLEDGTFNRDVYYSADNGVTWAKASAQLQLPDFMPSLEYADAIVFNSELNADLNSAWTRAGNSSGVSTRSSYYLDGYEIYWDCPYIYIFGGKLPQGALSNEIWKGVLARLQFTPVI